VGQLAEGQRGRGAGIKKLILSEYDVEADEVFITGLSDSPGILRSNKI